MISIPRERIEIHVERQVERRTYVEYLQGEIQRVTAAQVGRRVAPEAECNRCHTHATWPSVGTGTTSGG